MSTQNVVIEMKIILLSQITTLIHHFPFLLSDYLLERVNWDSIDEALLHAISKGARNIVRIIADHPSYLSGKLFNH